MRDAVADRRCSDAIAGRGSGVRCDRGDGIADGVPSSIGVHAGEVLRELREVGRA